VPLETALGACAPRVRRSAAFTLGHAFGHALAPALGYPPPAAAAAVRACAAVNKRVVHVRRDSAAVGQYSGKPAPPRSMHVLLALAVLYEGGRADALHFACRADKDDGPVDPTAPALLTALARASSILAAAATSSISLAPSHHVRGKERRHFGNGLRRRRRREVLVFHLISPVHGTVTAFAEGNLTSQFLRDVIVSQRGSAGLTWCLPTWFRRTHLTTQATEK